MKKPLKIKIGHIMCRTPGCNTKVPVRRNEATGALSFPCIECGSPSFAKNDGSEYYAGVLADVIPLETSQDVPAPTAPAPASTSKRGLFGR